MATRARIYSCLGWTVVVLLVLARIHLLLTRLYDPDEFEHLHAAFCVARGMVPYRDFFEHHGPLPYLLAAPLLHWFGAEPVQLTLQRLLSFAFLLATLPAVWLLAVRLHSRRAGLLALVWLLTFNWFTHKSVEWRPDVSAMCFVTWAAWFLTGPQRIRGALGFSAGFLCGLAALCTPKPAFLILGMVIGAAVALHRRGEPWIQAFLGGVGGFCVPWAICLVWFGMLGAAADLFRCLVLYPLTWKTAEPFTNFFTGSPWWSPAHLGWGALGLLGGAVRSFSRQCQAGERVVTLACWFHGLAIPFMPAVFLQYYLLGLPLLAILTAVVVCACWEGTLPVRGGVLSWRSLPLAAVVLAFGAGALLRWSELRFVGAAAVASAGEGTLRPLRSLPGSALYAEADWCGLLVVVLAMVCMGFNRRLALGILWLGLWLPGIARLAVPHFYWSNAGQRADLAQVMRLTDREQPVLDGFTGLGCLRPHAFYWWWINHHSIPLITAEGQLPELQAVIAARKPALILFDEELYRLREVLLPAMERGYRPAEVRLRSLGSRTVVFLRQEQ